MVGFKKSLMSFKFYFNWKLKNILLLNKAKIYIYMNAKFN